MAMNWDQVLSLFGAFAILAAYALQTFGPRDGFKITYISLNLIGSIALTVTAVVNHQLGFILLEGIWALISAFSLSRTLLGRRS